MLLALRDDDEDDDDDDGRELLLLADGAQLSSALYSQLSDADVGRINASSVVPHVMLPLTALVEKDSGCC